MALLYIVGVFIVGVTSIAVVAYLVKFVINYRNARPGQKKAKIDGKFPGDRVALITDVAKRLGGNAVNDPQEYRFLFARTGSPHPRYGILLFPTDVESRDPETPFIVRFEAPLRGGRYLEVWPLGSTFPPTRVNMATPEIKMGEPAFDRAYLVRSDDAAFARSVLGRETRDLMEHLRALGLGGRVRIEMDGYKVRVQKEEQVASGELLLQMAACFEKLLVQFKDAIESAAGVEFFDAPKPKTKPVCPICSSEILTGKVECMGCKTPHHRECWEYNQRCSMFACGERQFSL